MDSKTDITETSSLVTKESSTYRWRKTLVAYMVYFLYGAHLTLVSLTIPDLCDNMGVTTEEFGVALAANTLPLTIGSVIMGFLVGRYLKYNDFMFGGILLSYSLLSAAKPFITHFPVFITIMFIEGWISSATDPVCNAVVMKMWGHDAATKAQVLHLSWGIGAIITPLLTASFLIERTDGDANVTTTALVENFQEGLHFEIPYLIVSTLCLIGSMICFVMVFYKPPQQVMALWENRRIENDDNQTGNWIKGKRCYTSYMLVLIFLASFSLAGREYIFSTWLFTYAVEGDLGFDKQEASILTAANRACSTLGMLLTSIASAFLSPTAIMSSIAIMGLALTASLSVWGTQFKVALWVISCVLGLFQGPLWPTIILYMDQFIQTTALIMGLMFSAGAVAATLFNVITGYMFENADSLDSFTYILVACAAFLCLILIVIQCLGKPHASRYNKYNTDADIKWETLETTYL